MCMLASPLTLFQASACTMYLLEVNTLENAQYPINISESARCVHVPSPPPPPCIFRSILYTGKILRKCLFTWFCPPPKKGKMEKKERKQKKGKRKERKKGQKEKTDKTHYYVNSICCQSNCCIPVKKDFVLYLVPMINRLLETWPGLCEQASSSKEILFTSSCKWPSAK